MVDWSKVKCGQLKNLVVRALVGAVDALMSYWHLIMLLLTIMLLVAV